jgi:hypothetical protein
MRLQCLFSGLLLEYIVGHYPGNNFCVLWFFIYSQFLDFICQYYFVYTDFIVSHNSCTYLRYQERLFLGWNYKDILECHLLSLLCFFYSKHMEEACTILVFVCLCEGVWGQFVCRGVSPVDCRSDWGVYCMNYFIKPMIVSGFGCKLTYSNFSSVSIIRWALLMFFLIFFWNLLV